MKSDLSTAHWGRQGPEVHLVEEVPGVPSDERYYIFEHAGRGRLWKGPTTFAAEQWAAENGVTIDFLERFEP